MIVAQELQLDHVSTSNTSAEVPLARQMGDNSIGVSRHKDLSFFIVDYPAALVFR